MRTYSLSTETLIKENYNNFTYAMKEEHITGYLDNIEAVKQAVYKILNTEKFEYPIYSFYYGIELNKLIGKERPYVRAELQRMIKEALMQDDRIRAVSDFSFSFTGDQCCCSFMVESVAGNITESVEVTL